MSRILCVLAVVLLQWLTLKADSIPQPKEWSYAECVEYAKANNISIRQSRLVEQTDEYSLEAARARWAPSLGFATTHTLRNSPWAESNKNSYTGDYGLNASWTVWDGGERENTIRREQLQVGIDALGTTDRTRTVETELLSVYINILYAREAITINEDAATVSAAQAERARQLMEAGRLSRVDYAQLAAQAEQDRYNVVSAKSSYDSRCMELKKLLELGIDAGITAAPVDWSGDEVMRSLPPLDESYRMAVSIDAKLEASRLEQQSAAYDVKIAKAGYYPSISLNAGVGTAYGTPGRFAEGIKTGVSESVGITLSVPILDNKKTRTAVAQARIKELNSALDYQSRANEIGQTVEGWYIDLRAAQARYSAGNAQVESARLSDELVNEQFELGLVNTVELMQAHNTLVQARHELLQAKYMAMLGHKMIEYYRTASVAMP
ncbi:MAG: TolC family protein [Muribaculaceae bacterium]|nr:TolC family protein [Muribaculaceae bacterium]